MQQSIPRTGHRPSYASSGSHRHSHRVRLMAGRFRYAGVRLHCGQASLFGDRIELTSWHVRGKRVRVIPLDRVLSVEYHELRDGHNLSLWLEEGEEVGLHLEEAHRWREYFEGWLHYNVLPSAKLLGGQEAALALSG